VKLKAQDVLVLLKLAVSRGREWTYQQLAEQLGMSPSEVHAGVKRARAAGLVDPEGKRPVRKALEELLLHGVKYLCPPERGAPARGMPTCHAAPFAAGVFGGDDEPPPVWPCPDGEVRGNSLAPLYRAVPAAAARDEDLYRLLVLVDLVRAGKAREREWAEAEIRKALASE
jgi:hypothetical protein